MQQPLWWAKIRACFQSLRNIDDRVLYLYYTQSGSDFGDALSYHPAMGKCVGFDEMLDELVDLEAEYARRGFVTFSLESFRRAGGYGVALPHGMVRREPGDQPALHAAEYADSFD